MNWQALPQITVRDLLFSGAKSCHYIPNVAKSKLGFVM
jgi:hypothetical protein